MFAITTALTAAAAKNTADMTAAEVAAEIGRVAGSLYMYGAAARKAALAYRKPTGEIFINSKYSRSRADAPAAHEAVALANRLGYLECFTVADAAKRCEYVVSSITPDAQRANFSKTDNAAETLILPLKLNAAGKPVICHSFLLNGVVYQLQVSRLIG